MGNHGRYFPQCLRLLLFIIALWVVIFFGLKTVGHLLIATAYKEQFPIDSLNNMISGRHLYPFDHYINFADEVFVRWSFRLLALAASFFCVIFLLFNQRLLLPLLISVLISATSLLLAFFILFSLLEAFPNLLGIMPLDSIRYYVQKRDLCPDDEMVFVPRWNRAGVERYIFNGDLYREEYEQYGLKKAMDVEYIASFDTNRFRHNSSQAPYDVVLIGDSYLAIGETDDKTLSEQLKAFSGLHTFNLSRAWYGPPQYIKMLRRYALDLRPRFALFCFFSGNDIQDIQQYENWLHGGDYYDFVLSRRSFIARFQIALKDIASTLKKKSNLINTTTKVRGCQQNEKVYPNDLGIIRLGQQEIPMLFHYWNPEGTPEELIIKHEWTILQTILSEFKDVCCQHEIVPVVVYIPHSIEVYAEKIIKPCGDTIRNRLPKELISIDNSVTAFRRIAGGLNL